jgi:glycosyltransferase involved in cell wall biosynthesis
MAEPLNLILLGDLDAPSRRLSSRTPILIDRLGARPEIGAVMRVRLPMSWPRFALSGGWGRDGSPGLRVTEGEPQRYRVDWALPAPHQQRDWLSALNAPLLAGMGRRIEAALLGRHDGDYLLWLAHPLLAGCLAGMNPRLVIFDQVDDFSAHPQFRSLRRTIAAGYATVAQRADLILTTAERTSPLWLQARGLVQHVPNGVDAAAFRGAFPVPVPLQAIPRPRLGYVGVLQERVDVDLMLDMAHRFPEAHFVFAGPIFGPRSVFAPLMARPNVHFLGAVPYDEVPAYLAHMDVCLLPHTQNALTASMNPLKLYEYLAAGRPVVSTPVPPTERFKDVIHIAGTPSAFAAAIAAAIAEADDPACRTRRQSVARANDWSLRVHEIWRLIQQALHRHAAFPPVAPLSLGHWEW